MVGGRPWPRVKQYYGYLLKLLVTFGMIIMRIHESFLCYNIYMTTNDLINMIRANYKNLDSLAQIATAVECMQEELADLARRKKLTYDLDAIFTHKVKVFLVGGDVDYIRCVSLEDAKVARRKRIAQGGVVLALVGTSEEMAMLK